MAQRIQNKRSSLQGKRPDGSYLEPGEIALNTNAVDPGLFFEANDGSIIKAGPTSVGLNAPSSEVGYGRGEMWYDQGNAVTKLWDEDQQRWVVASPPGGAPQFTVFVNSQSAEASDDLSNDGNSRPFATLNRACIEVARRSILRRRSDDPLNARFAIIMMTGDNTVYTEPGQTLENFQNNVTQFVENQAMTPDLMRSFNCSDGGIVLPRGASLYSLDMRKGVLRPTYYPSWDRNTYETQPTSIAKRVSMVLFTGNSHIHDFTFKDKRSLISVTKIDGGDTDDAILTSLEPHGFRAASITGSTINIADKVNLIYPENTSRTYNGDPTVAQGEYFAEPLSVRTFRLRKADGSVLLRRDLPLAPATGSSPPEFLQLVYQNTTHHRMSAMGFATESELDGFYAKVQHAFANLDFNAEVDNSEIASGENVIVAPKPVVATRATDTTQNASPYIANISLRSNYGMCGLHNDGDAVKGFKSVLTNSFTVVSLQNDAEVYEVFYNNEWLSLKNAYAKATNQQLTDVTNDEALNYLIESVKLENMRYFYRAAYDVTDDTGSGLVDERSDTRHYHTLVENGGLAQIAQSFCIGTPINFWAKSGGRMSISSANSNFGGQALRAEGFKGIGTVGGSIPPLTNFSVAGIRRPRQVGITELKDTANHKFFFTNANIANINANFITLKQPVRAADLLPYTLKPGTVIWAERIDDGVRVKATIASAGVTEGGFKINLESANNGFDGEDKNNLTPPFIRRFVDPRDKFERGYSLKVANTASDHVPPTAGEVLRFSENPSPGSQNLLVPGKQLDPGLNGGWNHVFAVDQVVTEADGQSPTYFRDHITTPSSRNGAYYVSLRLCDSFGPWRGSIDTPTAAELKYARGSYATTTARPFYTLENQLGDAAVSPEVGDSVWERSRTFAVCQPIEEAYITGFGAGVDPYEDRYAEGSTYLRGVGVARDDYALNEAIDEDDGTDTLGLEGTGDYANYADPAKIDPTFSHSKEAMTRFLNLLGYTTSSISSFLAPVAWSDRDLAITDLPALSGEGYAIYGGNWPVEFNQSSTIICANHFWEWSGYFSYSKGLPAYQDNPLSRTQRFDYIVSEAWGGRVVATGTTESGEIVSQATIRVDGRGNPLS